MTKKRDMASRALDLFVKEYGNTKQIALGCPECRFKKLESIADVSAMTRAERLQYDEALKKYRDTISVFEGVRMEGRAEGMELGVLKGRKEGLRQTARNLKSMGLGIADIQKATGLSEEEVRDL